MGMRDFLRRIADPAGDSVRQSIRAYHASPADFDAFDASKIGTGVGHQSQGYGLYFGGDPSVQDRYYRRLVTSGVDKPVRYEVQIETPQKSFLQWDLPISQQSQAVRGISPRSAKAGRDVYDNLLEDFMPDIDDLGAGWDSKMQSAHRNVASVLFDNGIHGVQYFDSPQLRTGTRNYVMFPGAEDQIRILRKYGLVPATLAAEGLLNPQQPAESTAPAF